MGNLVIMPAMAQRKESLNMGEFAEEAIIIEEVTTPKRVNPVSYTHLRAHET